VSAEGDRNNPLACFDLGFFLRVLTAAVAVVAVSVLGRWLGLAKGSAPRIAIAVVQVGLLGYAIAISVAAIRRLDEMQYRIQLEGIAFAFAASAILMTGWGFLAKAGLPSVSWGPGTWLVMVSFWALGLWLARRRYR